MAKKTTVSTLSIAITATAKGMRSGIAKANQSMRGLSKSGKGTASSLSGSFASMGASVKKLAIPLAALAAILAVIVKNLSTVASAFEEVSLTSERLGLATNELIALRAEAERTGASANTLDMGLQRMTRRISEAAQGSGEAVSALKELGIEASELATLSTAEQLKVIADAMEGVTNRGDRTRLMFKLFDSEGVALDRTLKNLASDGIDPLIARAEELGLAVSAVDAAQFQEFQDVSAELLDAWTGVKNQLAAAFAPGVTSNLRLLAELIADTTAKIKELRVQWLIFWGMGEEEAHKAVNGVSQSFGKMERLVREALGIKAPEETAASTFAADLKAAEEAANAAAKAAKSLADDIAAITEKFRTPLEVLKDRIAEIKRLMAGGLSPEVGTRAIDKALRDFKELERIKDKLTIRPVGAAVKGTTEGFAAVQSGQDRLKELAIHAKRKEASDKRMEELLKDILEELEKPEEVVDVKEVDIV